MLVREELYSECCAVNSFDVEPMVGRDILWVSEQVRKGGKGEEGGGSTWLPDGNHPACLYLPTMMLHLFHAPPSPPPLLLSPPLSCPRVLQNSVPSPTHAAGS